MSALFSRWSFAALLTLAATLGLTGCVKFKQVLTVNPNGSGKMELNVAISEQMLAMAGPDQDPFEDFTIEEMIDEEENGFVAFSEPEVGQENGYKTMKVTGYFEDINQVVFENGDNDDAGGDADQAQATTYVFADGTLTVSKPMLAQMTADMDTEEMTDPQMMPMIAPMLQGMEIKEEIHVPGAVQEAGLMTADGNKAELTIDAQMILGGQTELIEQLQGTEEITVTFTPDGSWAAGSEAAWNAELAAAKAQWEALKEQAAAGTP